MFELFGVDVAVSRAGSAPRRGAFGGGADEPRVWVVEANR